jgi:hypothetical protein
MAGKNGHGKKAAADAPKPRDPWHGEKGHWLPGNPGGPGNPYVRELARWRMEIRRLTPRGVFEMAVARLHAKAIAGHYPSLRLFLQYMVGSPDKSVDVDRLDIDELVLAAKRRRAERAARRAGVPLVEAPPTGIPSLPPPPPPPGRPESEWRRVEREAPKAAPPAGNKGLTSPWGDLMASLRAQLGPDAYRQLGEALHANDYGRPDARSTDNKRAETARGEEGAPSEGEGMTGAD